MPLSLEDAHVFLPKYLSPADRAELFSELSRLPQTHSYYGTVEDDAPYQGDGWSAVDFFDVDVGKRRRVRAVIISNTCDIAPDNTRTRPMRVCVSPIIRISRLVNELEMAGVAPGAIADHLETLRRQEISNMFYLPAGASLEEESVVMFDNLQSLANATFFENQQKVRLFSLSQAGFWYFLLKLAIHFCRANEGVARKSAA
ncbi:MAG: hypothetical protein BroJett031_28020 [Betaproteobacteria bacterium]|nr:MAG: hypothetical protein BroJett031_28020 [Betaproteobacteria bacterium]